LPNFDYLEISLIFSNRTTMESALKLLALAQPFGVGDAIKSWFGLFNLFLEANRIIIAENLHASAFSDIATFQELLRRQLQLIAFSQSSILSLHRWASLVREGWTLLKLFNLPYH